MALSSIKSLIYGISPNIINGMGNKQQRGSQVMWRGSQLSSRIPWSPPQAAFHQQLQLGGCRFIIIIIISFHCGFTDIRQRFSVWTCGLLIIRFTCNIKIYWCPTILVIHYHVTNHP